MLSDNWRHEVIIDVMLKSSSLWLHLQTGDFLSQPHLSTGSVWTLCSTLEALSLNLSLSFRMSLVLWSGWNDFKGCKSMEIYFLLWPIECLETSSNTSSSSLQQGASVFPWSARCRPPLHGHDYTKYIMLIKPLIGGHADDKAPVPLCPVSTCTP